MQNSRNRKISLALAGSIAALLAVPAVHAATWNAGTNASTTGSWALGTNWSLDTAPGNGDALIFDGAANQTNTNDLLTSIGLLTLNNAGWDISLGTLTLNGGIVANGNSTLGGTLTLGAPQSWTNSTGLLTVTGTVDNDGNLLTVGGAGDTTISSVISDVGGLTKQDAGTLTLSGANSYAGLTTVTLGTLKLGSTSALGTTTDGTSVASGGALDLNGFTLSTAEALSLTGTGVVSTGALTNSGAAATYAGIVTIGAAGTSIGGSGNITLSAALANTSNSFVKTGAGTLVLTAASTRTDAVSIDQGTLRLLNGSAAGTSATVLTLNGGNLELRSAATTFVNGLTMSSSGATITVNPAASGAGVTHLISGATSLGGGQTMVMSAGSLTTASTAYGLTLSGNKTLTGDSTYTINGNGNTSTLSLITGTIDTQGATRTLTFDNGSGTGTRTATISGAFTGSAGTMVLAGSAPVTVGALTATANAIQVNSTTGGVYTFNGASTFTGGVTLSSGTLRYGLAGAAGNGPLGNGGPFIINGGVLDTAGATIVGLNSTPITLGGNFAYSTSAGTAALNTLTIPGAITMAADRTITLNGLGALTLSGKLTNTSDSVRTLTVNNGAGTGTTSILTIGSYDLTGAGSTAARNNIINGDGRVTISGVVANGVSAGSALTYNGTGTLTLGGANTFTGVVTVSQGTLSVSTLANGGVVSGLGTSSSAAANLLLANGTTLKYTGGAASTDRSFTINGTAAGHSASLDASGSGAVNFTSTASPAYGTVDQTRTLTLTGTNTGNNILAANLADNGTGAVSVTKTGAGLWVLSGTNTFTGVVTINAGMLVASTTNSLPSYNSAGQVVFNGGTLQLPSAWAMADINTLVSNATKTAGALAIDTTSGNQTQTAGWNLGAVGLTKVGTGTLVLNQANTCPSLVVNDGQVVLDNATVTVSSSLTINGGSSVRAILGGTLNLAGATITRNSATTTLGLQDTITSGITGNPNVTKNTLYTGNNLIEGLQFAPAGGATQALGTINMPYGNKSDKSGLTLGGDSTGNTVTSIIGSNDMYTTVRKRGPGTWTLGSVATVTYQNYAGTTIAQGAITPSQYDDGVQVLGGTLVLDYTFSNASKLGEGSNRNLYLVGGTLQLDRSTGANGSHIEVVTATSLSGQYATANAQVGWANITRASGSTAKLRMNTITRAAGSGSTLNFGAAGIADCDNGNTNGILGTGWATVAGADFAYNSTGGGDGTINALPGASYTDVQRLAPGTIADGSTTNVRLIEGSGSGGSITLGAATTTINTLNQSASGGTGATTISMAGQTLGTYAILAGSGSGALTIGLTVGDGTLRAAASGGELILHNYSSNPLTINSVIANNTSASSLILDGPGTTILAGANTYSGVTKLSGGVLEVAAGTWLSTSTHLQLNGGVFQSSGSFTRANGYNTTAGQFNWTSEDGGGFAARGGKLTVKIGNNAATEQTWGWVVNAITPLVDQADNRILGPLKFGSATADSEVEFQNNINLNGETRVVDVTAGAGGDFATLSGVIRNSSTVVPAGLYKTGAGTLVLSGANTYNGATTVSAGTLVASNAAALGTTAAGTTVTSGATLDVRANIGSEAINVGGTGVGGIGALITSTGTGTVGGAVTLSANTSLGGAGTLNVNGVVTAAGFTVDKVGAGTTNLGTTSTLTSLGTLNATAGTTNVNSAVGGGSAAVSVTGGSTLKFGSVSQTLGSLSIGAGSTVTFTSGLASFSDGGGKAPSFGGGAVVPEPGTIGLLLVGALGVLNRRRRHA